jgi:glycosyltransferase involved in cell wall biosynthesis
LDRPATEQRVDQEFASSAMKIPYVSVVVPTRNRSRLLALTLRSILWQTDVALDVIVVDDGSTDDTPRVVAGLGDGRLRLLRHAMPHGVSAARNRGIADARGEWVGFCDDDDLWAPDKLARQVAAARAVRSEWVYTGAVFINDAERIRGGTPPVPPDTFLRLLVRWDPMPGGCSNAIVSRRALQATGGFSPEFGTLADWELWLRLAQRGRPACVTRPLVAYRVHPGNMSLDVGLTLRELDRLEARHGLSIDRSRFDRFLAGLCLRAGRKTEALRLLARAIFVDRTGYTATDAREDLIVLWRFALDGGARRLGLRAPWWQRRRHRRERRRDEHLAWKADAQRWLDALSSSHGPEPRVEPPCACR